jgi:hypothetical protein
MKRTHSASTRRCFAIGSDECGWPQRGAAGNAGAGETRKGIECSGGAKLARRIEGVAGRNRKQEQIATVSHLDVVTAESQAADAARDLILAQTNLEQQVTAVKQLQYEMQVWIIAGSPRPNRISPVCARN